MVATMIPAGIFNFLPGNDESVTSCGTVVETRSGLEDLESIIADEGTCMSLGIGRLIIGKTGGGDRPCGCSRVGEG
jgi:hypothetical protein